MAANYAHPFVGINTSPSFTFHCPQAVTVDSEDAVNPVSARFQLSVVLPGGSGDLCVALQGICDTLGSTSNTNAHYVGVMGYASAIAEINISELIGVYGFAHSNPTNGDVDKVIGVYGQAGKTSGSAPLCLGGYFTASGGTKNVGLYADSLAVGNSASGSTLGSVVKKIEVFDAAGNSLGFIPVYNSIT